MRTPKQSRESTSSVADLEPLREALLEQAREDTKERIEAASARADRILADARQQANTLLADVHAEELAQAEHSTARHLVAAHREGRALVLAAQRRLYDRLRERCIAAAGALRADPCYPVLQRRLAERACDVLGERARILESPYGGVIAELGSRQLDLSLPILAEHALDELEEMVCRLWA